MRIKVQAYIPHGTGEDPREPGWIGDIRDSIAKEWIKRQWAIELPDEEKPEPEVKAKAEVIETPEDKRPGLETASLKRKKK